MYARTEPMYVRTPRMYPPTPRMYARALPIAPLVTAMYVRTTPMYVRTASMYVRMRSVYARTPRKYVRTSSMAGFSTAKYAGTASMYARTASMYVRTWSVYAPTFRKYVWTWSMAGFLPAMYVGTASTYWRVTSVKGNGRDAGVCGPSPAVPVPAWEARPMSVRRHEALQLVKPVLHHDDLRRWRARGVGVLDHQETRAISGGSEGPAAAAWCHVFPSEQHLW